MNDAVAAMKACVQEARDAMRITYPALWKRMLDRWLQSEDANRICVTYSSSYLASTAGTRWAVDPILPSSLMSDWTPLDPQPLRRLSFLLLTHKHADHFDPTLLGALAGTDVRMVVPEHMLDVFFKRVGADERQVVIARPGVLLHIDGVDIEPFEGFHKQRLDDGTRAGLECTGYAVRAGGRRIVFPVDVRHYDPADVPVLSEAPDLLFAHVWLGRECAGSDTPPLLDDFCRFFMRWRPRSVYVTHMDQVTRPPLEFWNGRHGEMICRRWKELAPDVPAVSVRAGGEVEW